MIDSRREPCSRIAQIRSLPSETQDTDLFELGSRFGRVLSVRAVPRDEQRSIDTTSTSNLCMSRDCGGTGFILFRSGDEAERAVVGLTKLGFDVSFAKVSTTVLYSIIRI